MFQIRILLFSKFSLVPGLFYSACSEKYAKLADIMPVINNITNTIGIVLLLFFHQRKTNIILKSLCTCHRIESVFKVLVTFSIQG